jgi:hypothetical protein
VQRATDPSGCGCDVVLRRDVEEDRLQTLRGVVALAHAGEHLEPALREVDRDGATDAGGRARDQGEARHRRDDTPSRCAASIGDLST